MSKEIKQIFVWDNGDGAPRAFTTLEAAREVMLKGRRKQFKRVKDAGLPNCEVWLWMPNVEDNYIWKVQLE